MSAENNDAVLDIMEKDSQTGDIQGFKFQTDRLEDLTEAQGKRVKELARKPEILMSIVLDGANADLMRDQDPEGSKKNLSQTIRRAEIYGLLDRSYVPVIAGRFSAWAGNAGLAYIMEGAKEPQPASHIGSGNVDTAPQEVASFLPDPDEFRGQRQGTEPPPAPIPRPPAPPVPPAPVAGPPPLPEHQPSSQARTPETAHEVIEITDIKTNIWEQLREVLNRPSVNVIIIETTPEMLKQYLLGQPLPENVKSIKSSSVEIYLDKDNGNALRADMTLVAKTPFGDRDISFDGIVVNNPQGGIKTLVARHHGIPWGFGNNIKAAVEAFKRDPNRVLKENIDDQLIEQGINREFTGARIERNTLQLSFRRLNEDEFREVKGKWVFKTAKKLAAKEKISEQEALERLRRI